MTNQQQKLSDKFKKKKEKSRIQAETDQRSDNVCMEYRHKYLEISLEAKISETEQR